MPIGSCRCSLCHSGRCASCRRNAGRECAAATWRISAMTDTFISRAFDRARLNLTADWLAVGAVAAMPWSTSISQILIVIWLVVLIPTFDVAMLRREVQSPAGGLPVLLWLLGLAGMLW